MVNKYRKIQYYFKLNIIGMFKSKITLLSILMIVFVYFTVIDLHTYTSDYKVYQIDREITNRTISIDLKQTMVSMEQIEDPNSYIYKLINLPFVENYNIADFEDMGKYLNVQLSSYLEIDRFESYLLKYRISSSYDHHFSSRYEQISQFNLLVLILYSLVIILCFGLLGYIEYKEYKAVLNTLKVMNYTGFKNTHLLVFLYFRIMCALTVAGGFALFLERILIRNIVIKEISDKFGFIAADYSGMSYYAALFIFFTFMTGLYYLKGVNRDFKTL